MSDEHKQFETIAAIRAHAETILRLTSDEDHRPSTAKMLMPIISRMHNLKAELKIS